MQLPDVGIDKNPFRGGSNQRACIALAAILTRDANIYFRFVVESAIEADLSQWDTVVLCNGTLVFGDIDDRRRKAEEAKLPTGRARGRDGDVGPRHQLGNIRDVPAQAY